MWGGVFEARLRLFFPTCSPGTLAEPPLCEPVLQTGPLWPQTGPLRSNSKGMQRSPDFAHLRSAEAVSSERTGCCAAQLENDPGGEQAARYGACASPPKKNKRQRAAARLPNKQNVL